MCTYVNNPPGDNSRGLWIPYNGVYTVTETGLPSGWAGVAGTGSFTLANGYCASIFLDNICVHTVRNQATVMH
jgi:hypothetical protein